MTTLLLTTLLSSLISVGFYIACQFDGDEDYDASGKVVRITWPKPQDSEKMILWWVRYYGGRYLGKYWSKPVYSCLPCMGSLHSIVPTLVFSDWKYWPFIALATVGINYMITIWWKK